MTICNALLLDGMCGKIPHFKINNGQEADMEYMLAMRDNLVHHIHLIDIYALCIVWHSKWNDKAKMAQYCWESNAMFNDYVFSLLCLFAEQRSVFVACVTKLHRNMDVRACS